MAASNSRYLSSAVLTLQQKSGRTVSYLAPRILPLPSAMKIGTRVVVRPDERLDTTSNRVYGDPIQYHRLCDANCAMNPFDVVAEAGPDLAVPIAVPGD